MQHPEQGRSVQRKDSPGGFLGELAFEIVGDLLPDSLIGFILVILVAALVWAIRSMMSE